MNENKITQNRKKRYEIEESAFFKGGVIYLYILTI